MDDEQVPPSIEIPDLKKKAEQQAKEKKGAGAVGSGAQASSEAGLAGGSPLGSGSSALLRGASPVGAVRGGVVNLLRGKFAALASGKLSAPFAALFAGKAGALGMVVAVAAAGALTYGVIRGVSLNTPAGQRTAVRFDALASTIVPPGGKGVTGGSSFAMLANAAKGLLGGMLSGKKEEGKKDEEWEGAAGGAPDPSEMVKGVTDGVAGMVREKGSLGEMAGSKLSSELGRSNAFGNRNVFQGGDTGFHAKQLDTSLNPAGAGRGFDTGRGKQSARGNLSSMRRGMTANRLSGINTRSHLTDKALGQLKFARDMSYKGAQVGGAEAGSNYAADAFSGQSTTGGDAGAIGGGLGDVGGGTDPSGGGTTTGGTTTGDGDFTCPSGTTESNGTCEPDDVSGDNVSPDQGLIDACYGLAMAGIILIMVGAIIVQICQGKAYLELLAMIGRIMVIAGILMGLAILAMATQMQDQGYMIEWAAIGVAMMVAGATGLYGGTQAIIIMEVIMACALIYLGISQKKVEQKDNVDQEEITTTTSRSTDQFADLA